MHSSRFRRCRKITAGLLAFLTVFGTVWPGFVSEPVPRAEAAQVTIDADASANGTSHLISGAKTVFIDDQTGYRFFRDLGGYCVYRKTTDGGGTWSGTTTVDAQTDCIQVQVWYDKWTPGSASSSIHIATLDTGSSDVWYNRLDPGGDTLLMGTTPVSMTTGQGGSISEGGNLMSITRGTDGTIYAVSNDGTGSNDSYIVECTSSCNLSASWSETGTNPLDAASDYNLLVPLASGNIMLINRDISAEDIRTKIWNNSTWSGTWTTVDANATDNTTYDGGFAAAVSSTTPGVIYLAYADHGTLGATNDVRVAKYNGSTWATSTDVISNSATRAITGVAIGLDAANDDVYVGYSARTTAGTAGTGNVYWKWATSSLQNWSAEAGPMNSAQNDIYGLDINPQSDQRVHASWFVVTGADVLGDTIADIFPGIHATSSGSQTTSVTASTTNVYVGGKFVLTNTYKAQDVTGITITESGTIDGANDIANVKLFYESDAAAPYDCATNTYDGSENPFGSADANGFSGANGISAFTGTTVNVATSSAMCVYVVLDVKDSAQSSSTIDISIANPTSDITVTNGISGPATSQNIPGTTFVYNDTPTQVHFHFRNDNGNESGATSATGGTEDTALAALKQGSTTRIRMEVSNEGSSSTPGIQYRLEYGTSTGSCSAITEWVDVGASGGAFDMFDSTNLTDGNNTTNVAVAGNGAVTDENTSFLGTNGAVKDTSSQTSSIVLTTAQFVEFEYAIAASAGAPQGNTYCFRLSDAGYPLYTYSVYPRLTINADVTVGIATSSQVTATTVPATNFYVGSAFTITENSSSRNITDITLTETGTVDAQTGLDNIRIRYDLDTTAPYNCAGESYSAGDTLFGSIDTDGFSGPNGTSTFSGSVTASTTATMCVYVVVDVTDSARNNETINLTINAPSSDVLVSGGGSVSPATTLDLNGSTTLQGPNLTQTHYHWRNDNGSETTASSTTNGIEDTLATNVAQTQAVRLRIQASNEGTATSSSRALWLEYGAKVTTCDAISSWIEVGASGGAFDMFNSANLTDGNNTTNIAVASGGVTDENTTFIASNSAVKDTSSRVASTTIGPTQFLEAEFSMKQTTDAGYDTTYCFRLTANGSAFDTYTRYAELTTAPERDFEIQRGTVTLTGATQTITAGVDYIAPAASTSAFIRITNSHHTGAGNDAGTNTQDSDDVTVYIENPSNILNSVTFRRTTGATSNTRVSWEIVEFIGEPGSDNEMIVRSQTAVTYGTTATVATGTVASVTDDADVVVFITGQLNPLGNATGYNTGQSTSAWAGATNEPVFTRGAQLTNAAIVSYAVVEFTGPNWAIQRSEHTYTGAGSTETESITAVNSLSRTFLHTQKRIADTLTGIDEFGHEVWLSSVGQVSYFLESGATTPSGQTSVAWVIENTQTTAGAMDVQRKNDNSTGGTEPLTISVTLDTTLDDITNTSLFVMSRSAGTGTNFPRPIVGATIASTTAFELWRSDTLTTMTYRAEIVEWPTAGLALGQTHYWLYVDNNMLTPTDPWPPGGTNLGEDTVLTASDEPLGEGERLRIRMAVQANNATLPAGTRAFRLQYGQMVTSCSAITEANWRTLGNSASSTIWRGYNATGTVDGTELTALLLTLSDATGTLEEINDSEVNPYAVQADDEIEYDWIVEQNGATADTYYCFRMVNLDNTPLDAYASTYPQVRTASFSPKTQNWQWYDDETNVTPTVSLGGENVTPPDIANGQAVKLRVTVKETKNIANDNARFKLQYSEYANFSQVSDVVATSTCTATSTWCYANGGGVDNAIIPSKVLSDADTCSGGIGDGCGTHNESPSVLTGFRHEGSAATEYEFTIQSAGPRVNRVYYFRLYDVTQSIPVSVNDGESYPSLATEGASLIFTMNGVASSTVVEGVTTDIDTTPTSVNFGVLTSGAMVEGAHQLEVDANGTEGYQLFMAMTSDFMTSGGATIKQITGTNISPVAWATGCDAGAISCFGYHTGDDTLEGGSTRFSAVDTYARFSTTTAEEVSYSSQPVSGDTTDIVFRVLVRDLQDAGIYETNIVYISVPIF